MRERTSSMEKLNQEYLNPILTFCGLYVNDYGYICSAASSIPYRSAEDEKIFIVINNYKIYEYFLKNKEECIAFNPYTNKKHLVIITKFLRNAIFQIDNEFDDFFYENKIDPITNEVYKEERDLSEDEIFHESEKHINLINIPADYRGILRKRWIIHTNLRNQVIDKMLVEVALPKEFSMNVSVILSMREIVRYYDIFNQVPQYNNDFTQEAIHMSELIEKMGNENKNNKKKFVKQVEENHYSERNYLHNVENGEKDQFGNVIMPYEQGADYN